MRYTGTLKLPTYVKSAVSRYLNEGPRGLDWQWDRVMTPDNKRHFGQFLVSIHHPLAYQAGTEERRFKTFITDHVIPYIDISTHNPGVRWHETRRREADQQDRMARKPALKEFFHGKSVAHLESGLAARAMGMNPSSFHVGQRVRLNKRGLEAYGLDDLIYTVKRVYQKPGYKAWWVELNELRSPYNKVPANRLEAANPGRPHGKFRSCVKQVRRSLKHYGRRGDPKRICGASVKRNPIAIYGVGNPRLTSRPGLLYSRTHEYTGEKLYDSELLGSYKHSFKNGVEAWAIPAGTKLVFADGKYWTVKGKPILLQSRAGKALWRPH